MNTGPGKLSHPFNPVIKLRGRVMIYNHCISTVKFDINHTSGKEGPLYDPFPYDEWCVSFKSPLRLSSVTLHEGLSTWIKIGETFIPNIKPIDAFTYIFGFTTDQLRRWEHRLTSKCPSCQCKSFSYTSDAPHWHVTRCTNCNRVIESYLLVPDNHRFSIHTPEIYNKEV
jgi:hypothetical protein